MKLIKVDKNDYINIEDIISITDGQVGLGGEKAVWVNIRQRGFITSNRKLKSLIKELKYESK